MGSLAFYATSFKIFTTSLGTMSGKPQGQRSLRIEQEGWDSNPSLQCDKVNEKRGTCDFRNGSGTGLWKEITKSVRL